ncbi:hypothetical protein [Pseudomonas saliphila]|uniref:hypothetical protein n=1 Tax=Pseudomonas saliphila TaxID=2586906 RepID=UPI00123A4BEE|nr:hypothetical protein [Pseudomonas saliphila]
MSTVTQLHPRITLKIGIDLEPGCLAVEEVRRAFELAAVEAIEAARESVREKTSARIGSYQMRSSVTAIPEIPAKPVARAGTNGI